MDKALSPDGDHGLPVIQVYCLQLRDRGRVHKVAVIACARQMLGIWRRWYGRASGGNKRRSATADFCHDQLASQHGYYTFIRTSEESSMKVHSQLHASEERSLGKPEMAVGSQVGGTSNLVREASAYASPL